MDRRFRFAAAQIAWMLGLVVLFTSFETVTYESFFVVSFVGFLVLTELTAPYVVRPRWRVRLWWFVLLGFVGFGYVAIRRVLRVVA